MNRRDFFRKTLPALAAAGAGAVVGWACASLVTLDASNPSVSSVPQLVGSCAGAVATLLALRTLDRSRHS